MRFLLFVLLSFGGTVAVSAQRLSHSTYVVNRDLDRIDFVDQIDFQTFDYIYLMAAPAWKDEDFSQPEDLLLKHLVHDFNYVVDQGVEVIPYLIERAHGAHTKVLLSFAGDGFRERVEHAGMREKFVHVIVAFIAKYRFDGVEIDWERDLSLPLHALFLREIRAGLTALEPSLGKKLYLTTALHSWQKYDRTLADDLASSVDWINVMTYDMGGGIWGNRATHNTPLDQMERDLENWTVFNPNQICIGLANYGFIYKGLQPGESIPGKLDQFGAYISYNQMLPLLEKGWEEQYDSEAEVSYFFSPDHRDFITMDTPRSIRRKVEWVKQRKYRGVFWWEFHCDMIPPASAAGKIRHHLIDHVSPIR